MGPGPVEVSEILTQYLVEMALAQDKDMIQALASDAAKKALNQRIRTRCTNRCAHDPDPTRLGYSRECRSELGVVVAEQESRQLVEGSGLAELLGDPGIGRVTGHAQMHDAARGMLDDEEGEQGPEGEVGALEKVAGPDAFSLVAEEGRPGLPARSWSTSTPQILLDSPFGHPHTQLQEFATDALGAPEGILGRHGRDEGDRLHRNRWPADLRPRPPPPEDTEAMAMPAKQSSWLDNDQHLAPGAEATSQ